MPIGIIASLVICTVLYIAVAAVLTGMVPYNEIDLDAPVSNAFARVGLPWAQFIISLGLPTLPTWQARFEACQAMISRVKGAGGQAEMLAPPERGIRGNSHMIMQDRNSLQIADLILRWIGAHAGKK